MGRGRRSGAPIPAVAHAAAPLPLGTSERDSPKGKHCDNAFAECLEPSIDRDDAEMRRSPPPCLGGLHTFAAGCTAFIFDY